MRGPKRAFSVASTTSLHAEHSRNQHAIGDDTGGTRTMEIRAFGASEVIVDGQAVTFSPAKCKWIVMLLALAGAEGRAMSKRELSLALWPWAAGSEYNVNRLLASVRRALGSAAERLHMPAAHTLRMNLDGAEFDVLRFRAVLDDAELRGDPSPIEAAVHLRPGLLFSDFPDGEASVEPLRSKLRLQLLTTLEVVAGRAKDRNDRDAEARALALAIEENPLPDELRTRRLIQLNEGTGTTSRSEWAVQRFYEKGGSRTADLPAITGLKSVSGVSELRPDYVADRQSASGQLRAELTRAFEKENTAAAIRRLVRNHPQLLVGSDFAHAGILMSSVELGHKSHGDRASADFAYIEPQSGRSYVHLVSFADPAARIFSEREEFTTQFHHALESLEACTYWIGRNQFQLPSVFGPRYEDFGGEPLAPGFFIPRCTLVIGRRSELTSSKLREKLEARRGNESTGLAIRTYDGFLEEVDPIIRLDPSNDRGIRCVAYGSD